MGLNAASGDAWLGPRVAADLRRVEHEVGAAQRLGAVQRFAEDAGGSA